MKRAPLSWQQIGLGTSVALTSGLVAICFLTGRCGAEPASRPPARTEAMARSLPPSQTAPQPQGTRMMRSVTPTKKSRARVEHVESADFRQQVLNAETPVLVDFYADWCGPCRMLSPVLEELAREAPEARIVKIDVDKSPEIAAKYGVNSIPMLVLFKDGEPKSQIVGLAPKNALRQLLSK